MEKRKKKEINSYKSIKNKENVDNLMAKFNNNEGKKKVKKNQPPTTEKPEFLTKNKEEIKKVKKNGETLKKIEEESEKLINAAKNKLSKIKSFKIPKLGLKKIKDGGSEDTNKKIEKRHINLPKLGSIYETDFDRIYEIVEKENIVKVTEIAEAFNVDKSIVMRWGDILNEHELIDFHIPAFGEPEFRKKGMILGEKKIENKKKKVIINVAIIGVFLLVVGGFLIMMSIISSDIGNKPSTLRLMPTETAAENTSVSDVVKKAFSGNGTYTCRDDIVRYYIKDQLLRADGTDGKSAIIIKEGFSYTYDVNRDKWIKSEVKKDIVLPGSGKFPSDSLNCKEEALDISIFNIPEGKIE